eukprot:scaffold39593_cov176-Amphora_coffeaeformis.AAC.1
MLEKKEEEIEAKACTIQGGTTDVGLHTGCLKRNTSAPLVFSVIKTALHFSGEVDDDRFRTLLAIYLTCFLDDLPKITLYDARKIDRYVIVMREADPHVMAMKNDALRKKMLAFMKGFRDHLQSVPYSKPRPLLKNERCAQLLKNLKAPDFPTVKPLGNKKISSAEFLERARKMAMENIKWCDIESGSFNGKRQDAWVQFHALNLYFWRKGGLLDDDHQDVDVGELTSQLDRLVKVIQTATQAADGTVLVMSVAIRSCLCLATWISFCWAHRMAEKNHVWFANCKPALFPEDLEVLVLEYKGALTAASKVRAFLESRAQKEVCPFRNPADSLVLASWFGFQTTRFTNIHNIFINKANEAIDERWINLQKQQNELRALDRKLLQAKQDLSRAKQNRESATSYDFRGRLIHSQVYCQAVQEEDSAQGQVNSVQSQIRSEEVPPSNLELALPRSRDMALQWLFFLDMDPHFKRVASLSRRGQLLLWERTPAQEHVCPMSQYFIQNGGQKVLTPTQEGEIVLAYAEQSFPRHNNVRNFARETGVYFPDAFQLNPTWNQPNPFSGLDKRNTVKFYTERLCACAGQHCTCISSFVQHLSPMLPTATRDNDVIARREERPEWLSPEQYSTFGLIRAAPRTQFRNWLQSLCDDLLPFGNDCVQILLKQAVLQIGHSDWNTDLDGHGLILVNEVLGSDVETLRQSPQNTKRLQLVGMLLAYFAQYHKNCAAGAREASLAFSKWAEDMQSGSVEEKSGKIYAKQALYYASAILCLSYFEPSSEDILWTLRFIVLFQNASLLSGGEVDSTLNEAVTKAMGARIASAVNYVRSNPFVLSDLLKLVDETSPAGANWRETEIQASASTACFEMISQGHLYSINLLNGIVLFDGSPKHFLPTTVVDNVLFQRTFGRRNFEVKTLGSQHYQTVRLIDQRAYQFKVDAEQGPVIFEYDCSSGAENVDEEIRFQLLHRASVGLPQHLQEPYSHWYSRALQLVVLRQPEFTEKGVHYIMTPEGTFKVPHQDRHELIHKLVGAVNRYEQVRVGTTPFTEVLSCSQFEKLCYVLTYITYVGKSRCLVRYHLPRYGLNFVQQQDENDLRSTEHAGYHIAEDQDMMDTLPGLRCFLRMTTESGDERLLIPHLAVKQGAKLAVPDTWDTSLHTHKYNVHQRFRHLIPSDALGAMQLASLYASNSCLLPDRRLGKPGDTIALDLVRHSIQNEKFTADEEDALSSVAKHSNLSCSLRLMVWWAWRCSVSLKQPYGRAVERHSALKYDPMAVDQYRNDEFATRLNPDEEELALGSKTPKHIFRPTCFSSDVLAQKSSHGEEVKHVEMRLRYEGIIDSPSTVSLDFPLRLPDERGGIATNVLEDLRESFETFAKLPCYSTVPLFLEAELESLLDKTSRKRTKLEEAILSEVNKMNSSQSISDFLTGRREHVSCMDLVELCFDLSGVLGKGLTTIVLESIQARAIDWCLLCVLEDKLRRLITATEAQDQNALVQELRCVRHWSPFEHPRWLAFEVEQGIQIRPQQYSTVKQLLQNPGSAIQLNMGQGKTRVLVPMLIMEMCKKRRNKVRVNLLLAVFHEAIHYYRRSLAASKQSIKIFTIPFQRDFVLDESSAKLLSDEMTRCWTQGGCLFVTPQHSNSLLLKQHDVGIMVPGLGEDVTDLFDESDAILHYKFQLVYAVGNQIPLPARSHRCAAVKVLLTILARDMNEVLQRLESADLTVHREEVAHGSFPNLRFLKTSQESEQVLAQALTTHLMDHPPYHFRWMTKHVAKDNRDLIMGMVTNPKFQGVDSALSDGKPLHEFRSDILALRGCLSYGLLFHALKNRYRVDFGLKGQKQSSTNDDSFVNKPTMLAVPYAASDTPKERAEFSHPDMAILYTCLSYLQEGLTRTQFSEAMDFLALKGRELQRHVFDNWIKRVRGGIPSEELENYDDIRKVDVTNEGQLEQLYLRLHRCIEVIFFWLDEAVFPNETHQFPQRRVTSSFNLSASGKAIGFSGTDDIRPLLPPTIRQIVHCDDELRATNGQMINLILESTKPQVHTFITCGSTMWKTILDDSIRFT